LGVMSVGGVLDTGCALGTNWALDVLLSDESVIFGEGRTSDTEMKDGEDETWSEESAVVRGP
jgi:hypothetical protein